MAERRSGRRDRGALAGAGSHPITIFFVTETARVPVSDIASRRLLVDRARRRAVWIYSEVALALLRNGDVGRANTFLARAEALSTRADMNRVPRRISTASSGTGADGAVNPRTGGEHQ